MRHSRRARAAVRANEAPLGLHPRRRPSASRPTSACRTAIVIRAGGRDLRVVARPGHSTTDTLFVDGAARLAFVGDHLLAEDLVQHRDRTGGRPDRIATAGANRVPRATSGGPRRCRSTGCFPVMGSGHRAPELVRRELSAAPAAVRSGSSASSSEGPANAYAIAGHLWSDATVARAATAGRLGGARAPRPAPRRPPGLRATRRRWQRTGRLGDIRCARIDVDRPRLDAERHSSHAG